MNDSSPSAGVWFPQWADVLAGVRLKDLERRAYRLAIVEYLSFCKRSRQRATVGSARMFMAQVEGRRRLGKSQLAVWKGALNWFFKMASSGVAAGGGKIKAEMLKPEILKAQSGKGEQGTSNVEHRTANIERGTACAREKEPPAAALDTGGPVWERRLIRELRGRHYEWRTEQAYRMWARRFAAWLSERRHGFDTSPSIPLPDRGGEGELVKVTTPRTGRDGTGGGEHLIRPAATFSPADAEKGWQWRHPREMGAAEVVAFLNHLAGVEHVAAATQNQVKKGQSKAR